MKRLVAFFIAWSLACGPLCFAQGGSTPPNLLLIVADDVGIDMIGAYGGSTPAHTPNIDALAAQGLVFREAWSNPNCSPTRAQLMTGRHGFRTGVGTVLNWFEHNPGLQLSELTLPEMLAAHDSAAVGKWHLGSVRQGLQHPLNCGFARFLGEPFNINFRGGDYFSWKKVVGASLGSAAGYVTSDTADDAIWAATTMQEPWFLYTAFHSAHSPWHTPPAHLTPIGRNSIGALPAGTPHGQVKREARLMIEAMDTEIGRMLAAIRASTPNVVVVFIGDNGTPRKVATHGRSDQSKGSVYQRGVHVPLIVAGPGVRTGNSNALVGATDIFATFAELAGVPSSADDSVSLVPYFSAPAPSIRKYVYAERFERNGLAANRPQHQRAIRDRRYKLIRRDGGSDEFYDLRHDPEEALDLYPRIIPGSELDHRRGVLEAELAAMGVD